jgi:hypothetical protein
MSTTRPQETPRHADTIILFVLLLGGPAGAYAQSPHTDAEPNLPWLPGPGTEARQALKEGLAAAQDGDWNVAMERFKGAQAQAPVWPAALFNLGWAYDKAGGRQLLAAIWYRAYLAARPEASDAQAVQHRIEELLEAAAQAVERIMSMEEEVAGAVPAKDSQTARQLYAQSWLKLGRPDKAWEIARRMKAGPQSWVGDIVREFARSGQIETAIQCAEALRAMETNDRYRSDWAFSDIVRAQAEAGKIEDALKTLQSIQFHGRTVALAAVAKAQADRGDFAGCHKLAELTSSDAQRAAVLRALALGLAERGDIEAAEKVADGIPVSERPDHAEVQIAFARHLLRQGRQEWRLHAGDYYVGSAREKLGQTVAGASEGSYEVACALVQVIAEADSIQQAEQLLASYEGYFIAVRPDPWFDLTRTAARTAETETAPQQVWQLLRHTKQKIDAPLFDYRREQYLLCLSEVTETLAQRGAAPLRWAEVLDWAAIAAAFGTRLNANLGTLEAAAREDHSKYTLLPSQAGDLHLGLERFRRTDAKWKSKHKATDKGTKP